LKEKDFEIMAPVGSYESLMAAIQGGADSIYFGIEGLNMRSRSSNNFTTEDLRKIVAICGEHGIKSYLTVNTVIYGEDLPLMREIIDAAKDAGVSAIIAADVAGHGVEEGFPLRPFRDAQMDLWGILDLALPQHFIGILRDFQDHLHIQKTGLDLVFLLQKQNFGIDRT